MIGQVAVAGREDRGEVDAVGGLDVVVGPREVHDSAQARTARTVGARPVVLGERAHRLACARVAHQPDPAEIDAAAERVADLAGSRARRPRLDQIDRARQQLVAGVGAVVAWLSRSLMSFASGATTRYPWLARLRASPPKPR